MARNIPVKDAARELGVTVRTVWRQRRRVRDYFEVGREERIERY